MRRVARRGAYKYGAVMTILWCSTVPNAENPPSAVPCEWREPLVRFRLGPDFYGLRRNSSGRTTASRDEMLSLNITHGPWSLPAMFFPVEEQGARARGEEKESALKLLIPASTGASADHGPVRW